MDKNKIISILLKSNLVIIIALLCAAILAIEKIDNWDLFMYVALYLVMFKK